MSAVNGLAVAIDVVDADLPWDIARPKESEILLRDALQEQKNDPRRAIEIWTQIARAQGLQGKLRDAEHALGEAEKLLASTAAASATVRPKLRVLLERGRLLTLAKTPSHARKMFLEAFELASSSGETFFAIDAARMMSLIETPKMQNAWTVRAFELADRSTDPRVRAWRGALHAALAAHQLDQLQFAKALEMFDKAAACFRTDGAARNEIIARSCAARTLRAMGRRDEALAIAQELLKTLKAGGEEEGLVYEEIAECLHGLNQKDAAQSYFRRAYELLSANQWLKDNESSRINRLKTLAKVKA